MSKKKYCISLTEREIALLDFMRYQEGKTRSAFIAELIQKQAKRTKTDKVVVANGGAIIL